MNDIYEEYKSMTEQLVWARRIPFSKIFPDGKILNYTYNDDKSSFIFRVVGTEKYHVSVYEDQERNGVCNCDCYYFLEGYETCKHIGGVLEFMKNNKLFATNKVESSQNSFFNTLRSALKESTILQSTNQESSQSENQLNSRFSLKWNICPSRKYSYNQKTSDNLQISLDPYKVSKSSFSTNDTLSLQLSGTLLNSWNLINRAIQNQCDYLTSIDAEAINGNVYNYNTYNNSYSYPKISISKIKNIIKLFQSKGQLYYNNTKVINVDWKSKLQISFDNVKGNSELFITSIKLLKSEGDQQNLMHGNGKILDYYHINDDISYLFLGENKTGITIYCIENSINLNEFKFLLEKKNQTNLDQQEFNILIQELDVLLPQFQLPETLQPQEITLQELIPRIYLSDNNGSSNPKLKIELSFFYPELGNNLVDTLIYNEVDKNNIVYRSNKPKEQLRASQLNEILQSCNLQTISKVGLFDTNDGITFVLDAINQLSSIGFEILGQDNLKTYRHVPASIDIRINSGIDWMNVEGGISFDGNVLTLPEIVKLLKSKTKFIPIGNKIGVLPEQWLEKHTELFALAEVKDNQLVISKWHLNLLEDFMKVLQTKDHNTLELKKQIKRLNQVKAIKQLSKPDINAELRSYQQSGYEWLHFIHENNLGGILADDMGLGKTIQIIAFLNSIYSKKCNYKTLIIIPTSLLSNWQSEIKRFAPLLKYGILYGNDRDSEEVLSNKNDLIITTYGTMLRDLEFLKAIKWECVILDEAQQIKNPNSLTYKAVKLFQANCRISMTGTPVENSLMDLWSQFSFLNPAMLGGSKFFQDNFIKDSAQSKTKKLLDITKPFILRRVKEDVAKELGDKVENIIYIDFDPEQKKLYDATKTLFLQDISLDGKNKFQMLESLTKLRQICCHPKLIDSETKIASPKLNIAFEKLTEVIAEGHKVLIFSQFTSMLHLFEERLSTAGIPYSYLDGKSKNRQHIVDQFQINKKIQTFLISLKAGGVGLNLTSADYVFILDPWWNPAAENQAADRAHRIGQEKTVFVYRFVIKDSLEEKILTLQESKKSMIKSIITSDQSLLKEINLKDFGKLI